MRRKKCREVELERPGHVYRVDEETGQVVYMEDVIAESMLGRKLTSREEVRHRNDNPLDNRQSNLEIVTVVSEER